jgi:aspartyl-tRNA(Asn)/glutamyl-tRNA(Gln) amidotransferase subunit A
MFQVLAPGTMHRTGNLETTLLPSRKPLRLGRVRGLFEDLAEPSIRQMMDDVTRVLRNSATIEEVALPASFGEVIADHRVIMAVEAAEYHKVRLERHPDDYPPKIRALLDEGLRCPATEYRRCLEHRDRLIMDMAGCFIDIDALLAPATTGPAPATDSTGNPAFQSPWSYTGLPTVSFPTGHFADGLPLCVQVVGNVDEAALLETALACEETLGVKPLEAKG